MHNKYLVWSATLFLIIGSVTLLAYTSHLSNTATTTNTVSFSGEGKVIAKPDIAVLSMSIVTESASSKDAQTQNSAKSNTVTDFLKKQGVSKGDIKTSGYNIYPQYDYRPNNTPNIRSYQVNQSIEVKIRDLNKASAILDGVVTAGANQIGNLSFQIDKMDALKDKARKLAIDDAKKKARDLENTLGINLGKIINFSENTGGYPIPMMYETKGMGGGMGGGAVPGPSVPEGTNEITINVSITYQIK